MRGGVKEVRVGRGEGEAEEGDGDGERARKGTILVIGDEVARVVIGMLLAMKIAIALETSLSLGLSMAVKRLKDTGGGMGMVDGMEGMRDLDPWMG